MYDFLVELISTLFKHGLSLSSAGAIVFLLLKQRKLKKRMKRYFPWMFEDDHEMKAYAGNQLIIMENQNRIMQKLGVECANGSMTKSSNQDQKNLNIFARLSRAVTVQVSQLRRKQMKKIIVIDAGHGDKDPGAIGVTGKKEKDFNLTMALKVERLLQNHPSITVLLTRRTDVFLELKERSDFANKANADAFISIHANSFEPTSAGTETHYTSNDSKPLATMLQRYSLLSTGLKDRGVKKGSLYVTKNTKMPSCLLEPAFLSNSAEELLLYNTNFQDTFSLNISKAICEFFGVAYEIEPTPAPQPIPDKSSPYPIMEVTVNTAEPKTFVGYSIKGSTWIPSRPVCDILGAIVDYNKGIVSVNGTKLETQLVNGVGYVKSRDLEIQTGARVFWDKSNPKRVEIYPKLGA